MSRALRQHCGNFLHDSIRRDWPIQGAEDENVAEEKDMADEDKGEEVRVVLQCAPKEWPLFDTPAISSMRVTGFENKGGTVYFSVLTILEGFQWTVEKTYDEFLTLHKSLVHLYGVEKSLLPSRRLFGYLGLPKREQLVEMQAKFEVMLQTLLQKFQISPKEMLKFVNYPFTDVLSVTQGLAVFFYDKGEQVLQEDKAVQLSPLQLHCITKRLTLPLGSNESGQMKNDFGHLLDFLQHLRKMKISLPTDEDHVVLGLEQLTFDLSIMRSLEVLLLDSIEIDQLQGRSILPNQLVGLEIRRSLSALKDFLVIYPQTEVELQTPSISPSLDLNKAHKWTALTQANFKLNGLKRIDESMKLLVRLERLDLSYNSIGEIENLLDLPHLRIVDLSHNKISSLSSLHTKMGNVTKLGLASNLIVSLNGMQKSFSLQFLDLSNNNISEVAEVQYLSPLPCLEELHLKGNPITHSPSYRSQLFSYFPNTSDQLSLDGKKPSRDEQNLTATLLTPRGHRRVPSRTADIKPDDVDAGERRAAEDELQETMSLTNQLAVLRKQKGERWLAIFNDRSLKPGTVEDEVVAKSLKERKRKGRKHHHQHRHRDHKREDSPERESSLPPGVGVEEEEEDPEEALSQQLQELIEAKQTDKIEMTANFQVTVLEYPGSLHTLSPHDMDQLLMNNPLEECNVSVDSSLRRVLEVIVSANKTRSQRDLALLQDIKLHEGKKLAVCLQFSSFGSVPSWVVYCVHDLNTLSLLYITLKHGMETSRTQSPENLPVPGGPTVPKEPMASIGSEMQPELQAVIEETDSLPQHSTLESEKQHAEKHTTSSGLPLDSLGSLLTPQFLDHSITTTTRSQSPDTVRTSSPKKAFSASTTPVESRSPSRSPARSSSPVRSRTPDPTLTSQASLSAALLVGRRSPVKLGAPSQPLLSQTNVPVGSTDHAVAALEPKPVSLPVRKVVKKPGLDSQPLVSFFKNSVARERNEILMNVLWGGCSIPSSPSCEIEAGLVVSHRSVYLMEVIDPERHPDKQFLWSGENLPLATAFHSPLVTLSSITVGIFDQSLLIEFIERGALKNFVIFPRTYEQTISITENLKAALDASEVGYQISTSQDAILNPPQIDSGALFLNPDASNLQKLKESLVRGKTLTRVANFLTTCKTQDMTVSLEEEVKRITEDSSSKFEIVQYVVVGELSTDILPIGNGSPHLQTKVLVLTNSALYLCKEEIAAWPRDTSGPINPPFPKCSVLASHEVAHVKVVKICDKAQPIVSYSDPIYEFVIGFKILEGPTGSTVSSEWKLCVHDRQYIDQFLTCLCQLCQDIGQGELSIIHTADAISPVPSTSQAASAKESINMPAKMCDDGAANKRLAFFESEVLTNFAGLRNYQRVEFFKKYVAQAEFLKSDEAPLSMFLAHCSVSSQEYAEIEACIMTSNYAIYFVSDVENIRKWLDKGGPSSFARMSLLSKKDASQTRCFYRLWLKEIKEITVCLFYLSVKITDEKSGISFIIHTENASATLSFLTALNCNLNLRDSVEEEVLSELLSEYIDLGSSSLNKKTKKSSKSVRPNVELLQLPKACLDDLKKALLGVSPSITKNSSIEKCAATLQILCQQVMLLVEEIRMRESLTVQAHPHLIVLTNYGLYMCVNSSGEHNSPSVSFPSDLKVKKWCHIDLVDHVEIANPQSSVHSQHTMTVYLRSQKPSVLTGTELNTLCLLAQNCDLLNYFLHLLSLLWRERSGRQLPINRF